MTVMIPYHILHQQAALTGSEIGEQHV